MSLIDANLFPQAAELIHETKISDERKLEIKAMYIEALINFIDIFAQTEIGEGIEIDLQKVSLFVNSNLFENRDIFYIKNIDDIYSVLEFEVLNGLPLWRFLKLTDYQNRIFEEMYGQTLINIKREKEKCSKCFTCIWYEKLDTMFGTLERCQKPSCFSSSIMDRREKSINPLKISKCKYYTSLTHTPSKEINNLIDFRQRQILEQIDSRRKLFAKDCNNIEDIYNIPSVLNQEDIIDFNKKDDPWNDFALAFNNKRTIAERKRELREAICFEGIIRFVKTYTEIEIGNGYTPNIKNILDFLNELIEDSKFGNIKDIEDIYCIMEDLAIFGFDIKYLIKR